MEPYWMLRTGSVPYWMEFNMEASLKSVHSYLDKTDPFDEIGLMLFNHGVEAVGLPTISEWETVFDRATKKGYWIGADPKEFPMDYAQFAKYHTDIQKIPSRYPMPGPLTLGQFEDFFHRRSDQYDVRLEEEKPKLAAA